MLSLLSEFTRNADQTYTIIVLDEEQTENPRRYYFRPRKLLVPLAVSMLVVPLAVVCLFVFAPINTIMPGTGISESGSQAELTAIRLGVLQDSLRVQEQYLQHLQRLITGDSDSSLYSGAQVEPGGGISGEQLDEASVLVSENWNDHAQPALPVVRMVSDGKPASRTGETTHKYLSGLRFPMLPPAGGYLTRGFDARTGHYAVDIAVDEGTVVRSIGDGYIVFADWTQEGGYTIAVQHAEGYLSVYKHNQRLLKRMGDRVRDREAISVSGNSGEISSGPHLHFELWHDGLAQDPRYYFVGS